MFVRVFDKANKRYYKSIVYGWLIVDNFRQYIVINPYTDCFELVDYLDKSSKECRVLVETIQDGQEEWVCYDKTLLLKYKHFLKGQRRKMTLDCFCGYKDVFDDFAFLMALQKEKSVPVSTTTIQLRDLTDKHIWHYLQNQEDANAFMKMVGVFHDSTLEKVTYEEKERSTSVTAILDNSWCYGIVELCFEGVLAVNIRPPYEGRMRDLYETTLFIKDETVFWADEYLEHEDLNYDGSYIKALNLKWRKIG